MSENGISTRQLKIGYDTDLVREITMEVRPGRLVTLIGPNGCGKTTLLMTLTGELKKRGGLVFLDGEDLSSLKADEAARKMSVVMTYRVRPELMTCREVVELGRYPYTGRFGVLSEYDREVVREAMAWAEVTDLASRFFQNLSDGQKQRVMLARAVCQEPEILVLDEPTSFLDIRHKLDILEKVASLVREKNMAVLMSIHELEIAMRISDHVVALGDGRILKAGPPEEIFREDFIRKLYRIEGMDTSVLGGEFWFDREGHDHEKDEREGNGNERHAGTCLIPEKCEEVPSGAHRIAPEANEEVQPGARRIGLEESEEVQPGARRIAPEASKNRRPKVLMIQGTMSGAGKSLITAGLCRIFAEDGYRVAPFKSQNMALNSFITDEGLEMGRAQVVQAECARIKPMVEMNPILLKPTDDKGSQLIVNGEVVGNMSASAYFRHKAGYKETILAAYERLCRVADVIIVEGAGSPVELNLKKDDIVNMGLAEMLDAPVLLVGDIDRGGIFAQLLGTLDLLEADERKRVKGLLVNKFRGDETLFENGVRILEERSRTKVVGVIPHLSLRFDDEDSLSDRFENTRTGTFDIAVIRFPHIANFTDLNPFEQIAEVSVRFVTSPEDVRDPDMIVLPGSKNTIEDLRWMKDVGLADAVREEAKKGKAIFGICGGYQMLGRRILDPAHAECGGEEAGLCLLPVDTVLGTEKVRRAYTGSIANAGGILQALKGLPVEGYEIHMGQTTPYEDVMEFTSGKTGYCKEQVYGCYIHGIFDKKEIAETTIRAIAEARGKDVGTAGLKDYADFKESQYDLLAAKLRACLDMEYIRAVMGFEEVSQ